MHRKRMKTTRMKLNLIVIDSKATAGNLVTVQSVYNMITVAPVDKQGCNVMHFKFLRPFFWSTLHWTILHKCPCSAICALAAGETPLMSKGEGYLHTHKSRQKDQWHHETRNARLESFSRSHVYLHSARVTLKCCTVIAYFLSNNSSLQFYKRETAFVPV